MGLSVHQRSPTRRYSSDESDSPAKARRSPRRTNSSHRELSPPRRRSSPRTSSPGKTYPSRKARSPGYVKISSRSRSPHRRHYKASASRSPSPHLKRLRRASVEKDLDKEKRRSGGREDDKGRHKDYEAVAEGLRERRKEKNHDMVSRSQHKRSTSPSKQERVNNHSSKFGRDQSTSPRLGSRNQRRRHDRSTSPRDSKARENIEGSQSRGSEQLRNDDSVAKMNAAEEDLETKQKQKPSFELSGKLAEETNRVKGVTLLFNEPPEARKPVTRWRLYVFKAGEALNEPLYLHRQSCYLFGRERRIADVPTDHPSCSKQHAVIQYRLVEKEQPDGTLLKQVSPYLMDLGSTNGTFINDNLIEPQRYYELFEKDTIKFGNSSREYVFLHENSAG